MRRRRRKNPDASSLLWLVVGIAAAGGAAIYFVNKKQVAAATSNANAPTPTGLSTNTSAALPTAQRPADLALNVGVQNIPLNTFVLNPDETVTAISNATNSQDLASAVNLGAAGGIVFGSTWIDPLDPTKVDTLLSDGTVTQLSDVQTIAQMTTAFLSSGLTS